MAIEIAKGTNTALSNFRVVRHVTRPLLKLVDNTPTYVLIDEAMKQAEPIKGRTQKGVDGNPLPPPFIVAVTDLSDGSQKQMVCNEVLKSELDKQYPNDTYVGKYFELIKNTKAEGKRYNTFGITELAPVAEEKDKETMSVTSNGKKK